MATLIIGGIGTLIGGPLGGAVGALLGRQIDGAIAGSPKLEGPRLKELAVSTSSYGQPIARHYGRVRAPGTIIWATDLVESSETQGGGKGRPKTTEYSYSVSFAVVLSSRPIDGIGRIWADGNLLRGGAGDMKSGGTLRIHEGHADQDRDPLLAAALGDECPAHRGCAYVVFEDLQLADFGNRIPALSFEVLAGSGSSLVEALMEDVSETGSAAPMPTLEGFVHDGGSVAQVLSLIDRFNPLAPKLSDAGVAVGPSSRAGDPTPTLPAAARWSDGDFGREDGVVQARKSAGGAALSALRYYDPARDYQPGLQRSESASPTGRREQVEFPGVLSAENARGLLRDAAVRESIAQETLSWRVAELDPTLEPGSLVRAPGVTGEWRIASWEWREAGIELQLIRSLDLPNEALPSDPGSGWHPRDLPPQPSRLRVFEVPWDGFGSPDRVRAFAAVGAPSGPWSGAALYAQQGTALEPVGEAPQRRAIGGKLAQALPPGSLFRLDLGASALVQLDDFDARLVSATPETIARGANRLLAGSEILQFARAEPLDEGLWRISGLLRGRGATEHHARLSHPAETPITLLDERLLPLEESALVKADTGSFAAIGLADAAPVFAELESAGISRRPPFPCHGWLRFAEGALSCGWTRRARGGWTWRDDAEVPLVEQQESYEIGIGPVDAPHRLYTSAQPEFDLDATVTMDLQTRFGGAAVWVRQQGSFSKSAALRLGTLPPFS